MSTVAWDGRTLAVDSQLTINAMKVRANKLWQSDHLAMAFVGSAGEGYGLWHELSRWCPAEGSSDGTSLLNHFTMYKFEEDTIHGIVVEKASGLAYTMLGKQLAFMPIEVPFFAIGSGAEFAMGAMAVGLGAEAAVNIASDYDVYTGMGTRAVKVDGEAQRYDNEVQRSASSTYGQSVIAEATTLRAKVMELEETCRSLTRKEDPSALEEQVHVNEDLVEKNRRYRARLVELGEKKCASGFCEELARPGHTRCQSCEIPF